LAVLSSGRTLALSQSAPGSGHHRFRHRLVRHFALCFIAVPHSFRLASAAPRFTVYGASHDPAGCDKIGLRYVVQAGSLVSGSTSLANAA